MTPELTFFLYSDYLKLTLNQSYSMCLSFVQISLEDIQAFEKTYKGSEEELTDIKQAYLDFKGDMDQIMESVLCVQYTEEYICIKHLFPALQFQSVCVPWFDVGL